MEKTIIDYAKENNINKVKELLDNGVDVNLQNEHGFTALYWVSFYGYKDIVELLLQHPNIDVNIQNKWGNTALKLASFHGHKDIVKMLENHKTGKNNSDIYLGKIKKMLYL